MAAVTQTETIRNFTATQWIDLNTTDNDDVKIRYYPRIAVLQDIIKSGAPITQAILKEIYDMAHTLMNHKHKYTDVTWDTFGNTSPYPNTVKEFWTDIPSQYNNLVPLGSPLMRGVVFEKWYICPYVPNILMLDSAPLIYTRQFELPGDGLFYVRNGNINFPPHLQQSNLGLIVDFYVDTTADIGSTKTIKISVKDSATIVIDNIGYFCNIGITEIPFQPKNTLTHFQLQWIEGVHGVAGTPLPFVTMEINNELISKSKIYSLTPQVSLNSTINNANITSIYALYQLIMVLCNHAHMYLDFDVYKDDKFYSSTTRVTTLENLVKISNEKVKFTANSQAVIVGWDYDDDGIHPKYKEHFTGGISNVSMFTSPVEL
jgi:hypothetical protein